MLLDKEGHGRIGKAATSYGGEGNGGSGGGYYGGYTNTKTGNNTNAGGAGGSGFVSSILSSASTKAGNVDFPNTAGTGNETGHSGNGYARITLVE